MSKAILFVVALSIVALTVPAWAKHHKPAIDPPTLTGDCTTSTLATGSTELLGKITVDPVNLWGGSQTCTLQFASACTNARVCMAVNETNGGGFPGFMGAHQTDGTHVVLGSSNGEVGSDVIAYQCSCF